MPRIQRARSVRSLIAPRRMWIYDIVPRDWEYPCAAPGCNEPGTAGCDPCNNHVCEEHVWRGVAYGMDTTACMSCVAPFGEWE